MILHRKVEETYGTMTVTKLTSDSTRVNWQQYVDPAGYVPSWLTRLMLKQVPLQSLRQLKTLIEDADSA